MKANDWNPEQYLKFEKERTQPSVDLMMRINIKNPDKIIDMGCGPGNSTLILKDKWPKAYVVGLDNSEAMLAKAKKNFSGIEWVKYDMSDDLSGLGKFDIVFSNAALQWIADKEKVVKGMFDMLNENGVLAVQVPYPVKLQYKIEIERIAELPKWAKYFSEIDIKAKFHDYKYYYEIISRLSEKIAVWQTDYIHIMTHEDILEWDKGSGARLYLDALPEENLKQEFLKEYLEAIKSAYPLAENGKVLMPFTRTFFTVQK